MKDFFRQVCGQFATGVTVVTTRSEDVLAGLTVNAFCSVSLEPALVLVCIDLKSQTLPVIRESGTFAINILTDQQEHLSRGFAMNSQERYEHFCHASYHVAATGAPILDDVLAFIDARVIAEYPGGDHGIFLGQVEALGMNGQVMFTQEENRQNASIVEYSKNTSKADWNRKAPLAYYRGQYRHISGDYSKPSLATYYDEDFD